MPRSPPDLLAALGYGIPTEVETHLLRACLRPTSEAVAAATLWLDAVGDPAAALFGGQTPRRRLAPLLAYQALEPGRPNWREFHFRLRAAALHEQKRSNAFRQIAAEVLHCLHAAGLPAALSRGTALAETAYPSPALRHCHDLDLLLPAEHVVEAGRMLHDRIGLALPAPGNPSGYLRHSSDMPVRLHGGLFDVAPYDAAIADAWANLRTIDAYGMTVQALSATDMLGHVVVHGTIAWVPGHLSWVTDAWHLLRSGAGIDWTAFAAKPYGRLLLPGLDYLHRALGAPVPPEVLEQIRRASAKQPLDTPLFALGAQRGVRHAVGQAVGWRARATLMRWLLAPAPSALKAAGLAVTGPAQARYYAGNIVNLARRAASRAPRRAS